MSLKFVKSQVAYYRKNLRCGPSRDWNLISGLLLKYERIEREMLKELGEKNA